MGTAPSVVVMDAGPWLPVPPPGYGGLENVVATLVPELRRAGVAVLLAGAAGSELECDELLVTGEPAFGVLGRPYAEVVGRVHAHVQQVADLARRRGADLVHTHTEVVGPALLGLGAAAPPVLHTVHWDPARQAAFYAGFDGGGRVFVNAVSHNHERCMPERLRGICVGAVHLASPPSPVPLRQPGPGAPVVVLGRVHPTKGQDAAALACREADLPLVLAGPVGPHAGPDELGAAFADGTATHADVGYYTSRVAPLLDGDRRRWTGVVGGRAKAELLAGARALLMPVRWEEPGATVVVEALAAGVPVVGTARGALPELVEHGVTGFLAQDESELAGYLARVGELDRAACQRAWADRFTPAHMARGYLAAYAEVLRRAST